MADDNAPPMIITTVVLTSVATVLMCLRFWCKRQMSTKLGLDDVILLLAYTVYMIYVGLSIWMTTFGLGKHFTEIDLVNDFPKLMYWFPIMQFFGIISVNTSKSSFIITMLRLVTKAWQKAALWFMLITINGSMMSIAIVQFYQCGVPPKPGCINNDSVIALAVYAAAYSAFMDLVLTAFPSLVIWKLQMKNREKAGIIFSMSCGIVAGVVGLYKATTIPSVSRSADFTHSTAIVLIWLVAEVCATFIACSVPFLRPLVRRMRSSRGTKESYGLSGFSSRATHNKLGSRADAKGGADTDADQSSDRDVQPLKHGIVRRTDAFTVEYDTWSANDVSQGAGQGIPGGQQVSRREMC